MFCSWTRLWGLLGSASWHASCSVLMNITHLAPFVLQSELLSQCRSPALDTPRWRLLCPSYHHTLFPKCRSSALPHDLHPPSRLHADALGVAKGKTNKVQKSLCTFFFLFNIISCFIFFVYFNSIGVNPCRYKQKNSAQKGCSQPSGPAPESSCFEHANNANHRSC